MVMTTSAPATADPLPNSFVLTSEDLPLSVEMHNWTDASWNRTSGGGSLSFLQLMEEQSDYQAAIALIQWTFPVIILLGTVGNGLSLSIMCQREMRQTSTCFYLAVLAVADTTVLYISAFKTWLRTVSGFEFLHVSQASCKITVFLTYFCTHFSAWIIVAVTVERFLAVWFPLKAGTMCSVSRAKFCTIAIAGVFTLINCQVLWTAELRSEASSSLSQTTLMCVPYKDYSRIVCKYLSWANFVFYSFLPFTMLLLFNVLIIINLLKNRQVLTSTMTRDDQQMRSAHRKLAITLLSISFAWILTTMPSALFMVFAPRSESLEQEAKMKLVRVVCYILFYTNHAINFCLYCVTGNRFRHELKRLLCRKPSKAPRTLLTFKNSGSGGDSSGYPLMDNLNCKTTAKDHTNSNSG